MTQTKTLRENLFYNVLYKVINIIVPFILTPYVSRILGADGTGRYSYAFTIAGYFVLIILLGLNQYGNRTIAEIRDNKKLLSKTFWSIFIMQFIISVFVILSYVIYMNYFSNDREIISVLILYVISGGLDINWFFTGIEEFKKLSLRNIAIKIITAIAIFLFVKNKDDLVIYALIYSSSALCSSVILWLHITNYVVPTIISYKDIIKHIKPNLILSVPVIALSIQSFVDKIILGTLVNKTELGYYDACEKIIMVPTAVIDALGIVMLPRMSYLAARQEKEKSKAYIEICMILAVIITSSAGFGIMSVANEFVPLYYGKGFEKCNILLQILLPRCVLLAIANIIRTQYLIPNHKEKSYIRATYLEIVINIIFSLILIPYLGSVGVAIGTLIANVATCFYQCLCIRKEIPIFQYIVRTVPYLIAATVMWTINYYLKLPIQNMVLCLGFKIIIGMSIYIISILLMYKWTMPGLKKLIHIL